MNTHFTTFPYLRTERLFLRPLTIDDEAEIFQLRSDPEAAMLAGRVPARNLEEATTFIGKIARLVHDNTGLYWAISYKEEQDLIGTICFFSYDLKIERLEIGYELLPAYQHKGIMSEAIKSVIQFAFNVIGAKRITACSSRQNSASINLLAKTGFKVIEDLEPATYNRERTYLLTAHVF